MNRFFQSAVLFAAILCTVWVAVLWHWESTSRNMTVSDIALYLAALPLVIFGTLLGLRWAWLGAAPRHEAARAAAARVPAGSAFDDAATSPREDAERHATVQLLAAHIVSGAGASPDELLTSAGENKPAPSLDAELRDAEGLAVMSARIDDAGIESFGEAIAPALTTVSAQRAEWAAAVLDDHALRAVALLANPLANALQALQPWAVRLGAPDPAAAGSSYATPHNGVTARPMVRVLLGWPADWSDFTREVATTWARNHITAGTDVPTDRFAIVAVPVASGAELWLKADQLLQTLAREQRDDIVLLTACHSDLSDAAVVALAQDQRLFSSQDNPAGLMPGEAAAALLLANLGWPTDPEASAPAMQLHRPCVMRRDKSIEARGRVSSDCLRDCAQQALVAANAEAAQMKAIVTDADRHTPRGPEFFGTAQPLLPHLDAGVDMRLIGSVTGHAGIASTLLTIAAAARHAQTDEGPCLALCVTDAFMRLALVARCVISPDAAAV